MAGRASCFLDACKAWLNHALGPPGAAVLIYDTGTYVQGGMVMASPRRVRRAMALSGLDLPDGPELLVHSCEDCACPVSGHDQGLPIGRISPAEAMTDTNRWVCG